ncbi:Putative AAA+ ATPase domain, ABC transporter type 1, transmembrane domain-containing protein [Colletotrichum destructivum]|uniref:AAA+ ATPase domain, ABC transporter type 1, transmembrane domain-containing protein n=1 Tax=Colletotrichum destructivum TaxID=34406 RepID=A0AAX4IXZ2_9PEZI|nr:Putative AAA+ ATPase domain, ABC transporter type 1, transmembrane domain-containing protein [Colletotrichum destructivum]
MSILLAVQGIRLRVALMMSELLFSWAPPRAPRATGPDFEDDRNIISNQQKAAPRALALRNCWRKRSTCTTTGRMPGRRLAVSLLECFQRSLLMGGFIELAAMVMAAIPPMVLRWLLVALADTYQDPRETATTSAAGTTDDDDESGGRDVSVARAYLLVFVMVFAQISAGVLINASRYRLEVTGTQAKAALTCIIMNKTFLRPPPPSSVDAVGGGRTGVPVERVHNLDDDDDNGEGGSWSSGAVFNLASVEASRIEEAISGISAVWTVPASFVLAIPALSANANASALAGMAVLLAGLPIFIGVALHVWAEQQTLSGLCQRRVSNTQQLMQGIRSTKLAGWATQNATINRLCGMRMRELAMARKLWHNRAIMEAAGALLPTLASAASLVAYEALHDDVVGLDPARAFSSLALFLALKPHLNRAAQGAVQVQEFLVGCRSIEKWLESEEPGLMPAVTRLEDQEEGWRCQWAIEAVDAILKWPGTRADSSGFELAFGPGFRIQRHELVAVCGETDSGKSSLLAAVAGRMCLDQGIMQLDGSVTTLASASQSPWIRGDTIRNNITFGRPFNPDRYQQVLRASALLADLDRFPQGDRTAVGAGGQGLSSGQAQRVSIARALYSDADLVLIDDCLRNLDPDVSRTVFEDAICGLLGGKTRLLVTNQHWVARRCDRVLWLDRGRVTWLDSLTELQERLSSPPEGAPAETRHMRWDEKQAAQVGIPAPVSAPLGPAIQTLAVHPRLTPSPTYVNKQKSLGFYLRLAGGFRETLTTLGLVCSWQVAGVGVVLWLAWWTSFRPGLSSGHAYAFGFVALGLAEALLAYLFCLHLTVKMLQASHGLWECALRRLVVAPMSFLQTIPLGTMMDHLSRDVDMVDRGLIEATRSAMLHLSRLLGGLSLMLVMQLKVRLTAVIAMMLRYAPRLKSIRCREAELRAHANAALSEVIEGADCIYAYKTEPWARSFLGERLDVCSNASFLAAANLRWLEVRLDGIMTCIIATTGLLVVWTSSRTPLSPAIAGLIMSQVLVLPASLRQGMRFSTSALHHTVAVDRLVSYATEPPREGEVLRPSSSGAVGSSWPAAGEIRLERVSASHGQGGILDTATAALHDITLEIPAGIHVAVVGPTGAGKSTFVSLLLRLLDPNSGTLAVDDLSITDVPLQRLRSHVTAVPHDVVPIPCSTIRDNVDPERRHSDADVYRVMSALDALAGLGGATPLDLDAAANCISAGTARAQLLGLARVLLQKPRICVLDEALGTLGVSADVRVMQKVRKTLWGSTIVAVTHRMEVAMTFDRVIVLDGGRVQAYGNPVDVWKGGGFFRSACKSCGISPEGLRKA